MTMTLVAILRGMVTGSCLCFLAEASFLTEKGSARIFSLAWWALTIATLITITVDCVMHGLGVLMDYIPFAVGIVAIFLGWAILRQIEPIKTAIFRREATLNMKRYMESDAYRAMGEFRDAQFRDIEKAKLEDEFRELEGRDDAGQASFDLIMENIARQDRG